MNKSKTWLIIVVVLLLVNTAVLVLLWYDKKGARAGAKPETARDFLVAELEMTKEQQSQFDGLRRDHQEKMRGIMDGMRQLKDSLFSRISDERMDTAALSSLTHRISEKEMQRDLVTFQHFRQVRSMLQPPQQKKFDQVLKEVLHMMAGPPGPPRGPR